MPELGIPAIKAKIDSGARSSALHVFELESYREAGKRKIKFVLHPLRKRPDIKVYCSADVLDERWVCDSGGHRERRFVIQTSLRLGNQEWPIEITLTNREDMLFRMLLGRTAMENRLIIDPGLSYQRGRDLRQVYRAWPKPRPRRKVSRIRKHQARE